MLKSRLYEFELKKREEKANAEAADKTEIGWGHQIRSYVLQPYQLVKDLRTGTQTTNPQGCSTATSTRSSKARSPTKCGRRPGQGRGHRLGACWRRGCGWRIAFADASGEAVYWRP